MLGDEVAAATLLRARKRRGEFPRAVLPAKQSRKAAAATHAAAAAGEQLTRGDKRERPCKGRDRRVCLQGQKK